MLVNMKISDTPLLKQPFPTILPSPSFLWKKSGPPSFFKNFKNSLIPLYIKEVGGGLGVGFKLYLYHFCLHITPRHSKRSLKKLLKLNWLKEAFFGTCNSCYFCPPITPHYATKCRKKSLERILGYKVA